MPLHRREASVGSWTPHWFISLEKGKSALQSLCRLYFGIRYFHSNRCTSFRGSVDLNKTCSKHKRRLLIIRRILPSPMFQPLFLDTPMGSTHPGHGSQVSFSCCADALIPFFKRKISLQLVPQILLQSVLTWQPPWPWEGELYTVGAPCVE